LDHCSSLLLAGSLSSPLFVLHSITRGVCEYLSQVTYCFFSKPSRYCTILRGPASHRKERKPVVPWTFLAQSYLHLCLCWFNTLSLLTATFGNPPYEPSYVFRILGVQNLVVLRAQTVTCTGLQAIIILKTIMSGGPDRWGHGIPCVD
jgi:hypothetical protein